MSEAIVALQKAFKIRPCSDTFFASRKKPCLEYQIKRCSAPCVSKISHSDYQDLIKKTKQALSGKVSALCKDMAQKMQNASKIQHYEVAMMQRDRIAALQSICTVNFDDSEEADYIAIYGIDSEFCVEVISFKSETGFGNYRYFLNDISQDNKIDALCYFLMQFWVNKCCKTVYTNLEVEEQTKKAIDLLLKQKIKMLAPKQGIKSKMVNWAYQNAKLALQKKIDQESDAKKVLESLQELFGLDRAPNRIEVYDNSHIFGQFAVGVMIVIDCKGFNKKEYRCFKIREARKSDDYAMMQEVLARRFKNPDKQKMPDFVLIDGGLGHLTSVQGVIPSNIDFACIAKGEKRNAGDETFFLLSGRSIKVKDKKLLHFLQNIRDEAHRFAIKTHRNLRQKSVSKSLLDDIKGVGTLKKKLLLKKFGSVNKIKNATVKEIMQLPGFGQKIAEDILSSLK